MRSFMKAVLLTTLLVGIGDLLAAYITQFIRTGRFADKMLYYMAGGALGLEKSLQGGFWVGLLGLFFHFFISFAFTLLFFMAYPRLKLQYQNKYLVWFLIGFLYSPLVSLTMSFIILPLSKLPTGGAFNFKGAAIGWIVFAIVFSIPMAILSDRYYRNKAGNPRAILTRPK